MNTFLQKAWTWVLTSSQDPTQPALTAKGIVTAVLPTVMIFIHSPSLSSLPNDVYAAIVAVFGAVSSVQIAYGLVRKIFYPAPAFTAQFAPKQPAA